MAADRLSRVVLSMFLLLRTSTVVVKALMGTKVPRTFCSFNARPTFVLRRHAATDSSEKTTSPQPMANLYQEWTLEDDQLLWENRKESSSALASLLGRGLRGVECRLAKLEDVDSPAYERLFAEDETINNDSQGKKKDKLIPASEVLRRIQYDYQLSPKDFSILHYDRVDDKVIESPVDAPNESIAGKETQFVDALPEHRIVAIKYRERVVWDREKRVEHVFSNEGIDRVIATYDKWKQRRDAALELNRQRQAEISTRLQQILGFDLFAALKELSSSLQSKSSDPTVSTKIEVEKYVQSALELFEQVRGDPVTSLEPSLIPMSDFEALDALSELVALLPDKSLRTTILAELSLAMKVAEGKEVDVSKRRELPKLNEDDLAETFVRGSGPGGQKTNKTSNRVLLVHEPTQIRVECHDTRSLQQNRKIARKRLRLKLDEHFHGNQSKSNLKAKKMASKKAKTKARSRARQRKKKEQIAGKEREDSD